jgi:hypothetical protein
MDKPRDDNEIEDHHYSAHLAAHFLCTHTCKRNIAHTDPDFHDHYEQIKALPDKETTQALALKVKAELWSHGTWMAPHIYASIWHQLDRVIPDVRPCVLIPQ